MGLPLLSAALCCDQEAATARARRVAMACTRAGAAVGSLGGPVGAGVGAGVGTATGYVVGVSVTGADPRRVMADSVDADALRTTPDTDPVTIPIEGPADER